LDAKEQEKLDDGVVGVGVTATTFLLVHGHGVVCEGEVGSVDVAGAAGLMCVIVVGAATAAVVGIAVEQLAAE